ncbi:hypothetical protein [Rhodococcus sp. 14-2483-1-2]|uniref:hypothetical protein n=1 Tax=Rhodococcus sp. 14-2483-1-2 TaxID=2023147 RepID=UPI000B9AEDCD|nr:hypothetical protein [Rhodococcus sp. 14-2483-1-2]OZF26034.1 hypothetical protein CH295_25690 [Rhodococcus sp. 14-2483-1-2]
MSRIGDQFRRQLKYLETSSQLFDHGDTDEAIRLAVTLRVLLHDTYKSHSLLTQMGVKSGLQVLDTAIRGGTEIYAGGIVVQLEYETEDGTRHLAPSGQDGLTEIIPAEDHMSPVIVAPKRLRGHEQYVDVDTWWTENVIDSANGPKTFSRRRVVLVMANKDGGAHVDPTGPDADYLTFAERGYGETYSTESSDLIRDTGYLPFNGNAAAETVRQIAWELTETLAADPAVIGWLSLN